MRHRLQRLHGFTLIEVIVALFVVALGMGALLATLTSSADSIGHLRNKSFAQWIALNRISEVRLATTRPGVGRTEGELEYAGTTWRWRQEVSNPGMAGMLRLDVAVAPASAATADTDEEAGFPALGSAYGFLGTAVAPANNMSPDWSLASATPRQDQDQDDPPGTDSDTGAAPGQEPR